MVTAVLFDATMRAEDTLVRLERFKAECQRRGWGSPSVLAEKLGRRVSFWSDLWNGRKSFGEKLARALEDQMRLPRNTFDMVQAGHPATFADLNGFEGQLVTLFRQLSPDEQHEALRQLHQELRKREAHTEPPR